MGPLSSPALVSPPRHLETQMLLLPVFKLLFSTQLPSPSVSSFLFSLLPSFLHFSLHCLLVLLLTHAAALSAGLWLRIPAVVTNPRFLVANGLRAPGVLSFPLSFLPSLLSYSSVSVFLLLQGQWRLTAARDPHCSGFPVMASNSIFDSFSNYSSSLLRGEC